MKKSYCLPFALLLVCLLAAMPAQGQNSSDRVKEIRQAYAEAQEMTKIDEPLARTEMTVKLSRNVPGIGLQNKKIEYFGSTHEDEDYNMVYDVRLIRISYNVAARNYYEEYLYGDNGEPLFFFCKYDGYSADIDTKEEKRYYFEDRCLCQYNYKAFSSETDKALSKADAPELFEENDGSDFEERLKDFDIYFVCFNLLMNKEQLQLNKN